VVGLDIGRSHVRAVEVVRSGSGVNVKHWATAALPITDLSQEDRRSMVLDTLRQMFEGAFSTRRVASAVFGESVIVRILRLPVFDAKAEDELAFAVREEARDFIPFDLEEVVLDYQRLGELETSEGTGLEVLIVAVRKELINEHYDMLREAGLQPTIIDVGSFALSNALTMGAQLTPNEPVAVVDIGAEITSISIIRNETPRFTRDLTLAGSNITNAIVAEMGVTIEEAERMKLQYGLAEQSRSDGDAGIGTIQVGSSLSGEGTVGSGLMDGLMDQISRLTGGEQDGIPEEGGEKERVQGICEQFISDIASEVKRSLLYYENQLDGDTVQRLLLTGGSSRMANIMEFFEAALDIPVEMANPFERIGHSFSQDELATNQALLGVGLGLALRSVIKA
jgi:type IV pilus assembly protein PilM